MSTNNDSTPRPTAPPVEGQASTETSTRATGVLRQWRREDMIKKVSLITRGLALFFSFISFVVMASNNKGGWQNFNKYEEYRYVLAVAILSTLYTAMQMIRQCQEMYTGKDIIRLEPMTLFLIDFTGDQIISYLLISAASAAVPRTNQMRLVISNMFTDSLAASISMAFLAFFCLAFSALISGYRLSHAFI